jgi:hypothetical protein
MPHPVPSWRLSRSACGGLSDGGAVMEFDSHCNNSSCPGLSRASTPFLPRPEEKTWRAQPRRDKRNQRRPTLDFTRPSVNIQVAARIALCSRIRRLTREPLLHRRILVRQRRRVDRRRSGLKILFRFRRHAGRSGCCAWPWVPGWRRPAKRDCQFPKRAISRTTKLLNNATNAHGL